MNLILTIPKSFSLDIFPLLNAMGFKYFNYMISLNLHNDMFSKDDYTLIASNFFFLC